MRLLSNNGFCLILLLGALAMRTGPAAAGEADLAPYFERLGATRPAATHRPAPAQLARAEQRPVHRTAFNTGVLDVPTLEHTVFNHINLYRVSKGMRPLTHHAGLAATARTHSGGMATGARPVSHDGMRERLMPHMGYFGYRAGGEILAFNRGAGDPAQTAMRSWINSYRHKDVIEEDYTSMGVGVARRSDGAYYFTVLFIR